MLRESGNFRVARPVHIHTYQDKVSAVVLHPIQMLIEIAQGKSRVCIAIGIAMSAVRLIAQDIKIMTARLSKADQEIQQGLQAVISLFRLHEKSVAVLIPVFPWLDFKVCGGGGGGSGGAGGEGEGEKHQGEEKASFHKKISFLRRAISDKPIIAEGFIRCQL